MKNLRFALLLFFGHIMLINVAIAQTVNPVPFTFFLKQACTTSAGVFSSDGRLLRTLWSGRQYADGKQTAIWDGRDDNGNVVTDTNYTIKLVTNNVKYEWQGVIGNTSVDKVGAKHMRHTDEIKDVCIVGNYAYYTTGYAEQASPTFKLDVNNPNNSYTPVLSKGIYGNLVCSDGKTVFWAGSDPNVSYNSFIFATNIGSDNEKLFPAGAPYKTKYGRTYLSAINFTSFLPINGGTDSDDSDYVDGQKKTSPSGLAVQKVGNFLVIARNGSNRVDVIDKRTGLPIKVISVANPTRLAFDRDDNLWMISGINTIARYKINADGSLSNPNLTITDVREPASLSIKPDNDSIFIADLSKNNYRVFSTLTGAEGNAFGVENGYSKSPVVTNYKFMLKNARENYRSFIEFEDDGDMWAMDGGNLRLLHFDKNRSFINCVMYRGSFYSAEVDDNNPTRIFSDYLEYSVDYSKEIDDGSNGSWALVNNWGSNVSLAQESRYHRLKNVVTLNNGRTYALSLLANNNWEIVELVSSKELRFSGIQINSSYQLYKDGSLRSQTSTLGAPITFSIRRLTGFDAANNPVWGAAQNLANTQFITASDPFYDGNRSSHAPGEITSTGVIAVFNSTGSKGGYHLGGVRVGDNQWLWQTAKSTHKEYYGPYPTDGSFDIGNNVNNYAGSKAIALGRSFFWGYHGEFWKNAQVNKWTQVYDNGLMINTFGVTSAYVPLGSPTFAGMAGNAFNGSFYYLGNDTTTAYMIQNDEGWSGGVHRWKITGLNTIEELDVDYPEEEPFVASPGLNLMEGLPDKNMLNNNTFGWTRYPARDTTVDKTIWMAKAGVKTYSATKPSDLYIKYNQTSGSVYAVSRDLGNNYNVTSWKLKGVINYFGNSENLNKTDGGFLDVLDSAKRIIARFYNYSNYPQMSIVGNNTILAQGNARTLRLICDSSQSVSITADKSGVTFKYGSFPAITTNVFDETADWSRPRTLRLMFSNTVVRTSLIDLESMNFSIIANSKTTIVPPIVIAKDDSINTLVAGHPLGDSELLVSVNNRAFTLYTGRVFVGNVSRPEGYWRFKTRGTAERDESSIANSPAFYMTPDAPTVTANDDSNTIVVSAPLGDSTIVVSENNGPYQPYTGPIMVTNVYKSIGYWKFKVKEGNLRTESQTVSSPQFTYTPTPPILKVDDLANTIKASHTLGDTTILVSSNNGPWTTYSGIIDVGNRSRAKGFWKFKIIASLPKRTESDVIESPEFTFNITPTAPVVTANDWTNAITASHSLGDSELLVSENNGPYKAYTGSINVGNVARPSGYYKFKVKAIVPTRSESPVTESPEFTVTAAPAPPSLFADDLNNTLSASHELGASEIMVSSNGGPWTTYTGTIDVGNRFRAAGFWKFKIKAITPTRAESEVVSSPEFTLNVIPDTPRVTYDDWANTLSVSHPLGDSELLVSENNGTYKAYTGQIEVGNVARPAGYWRFKTKAIIPTRSESAVAQSPAFTVTTTPSAPVLKTDDLANTIDASHVLGDSVIMVSSNNGPWTFYTGTIDAGNRYRAAGFWKFKVKGLFPTRDESEVVSSPEFTLNVTPDAPIVTANDWTNTLSASHALGDSEILVSTNNGPYTPYNGPIAVGNVVRFSGYWKFKTRTIFPTRSESAPALSPAFTYTTTPAAPTLHADDINNTLSASSSLGTSEIMVSSNNGPWTAYTGPISVTDRYRAAGFWRFKIKAATPTRCESSEVASPVFTLATQVNTSLALMTIAGAPNVDGDDDNNTLTAGSEFGSSEILVSENGGSYEPFTGFIQVGNTERPAGYWKFKVKAAAGRAESTTTNSPAFTITTMTPSAPILVANDAANTLVATHQLGSSEILVSTNGSAFVLYSGTINVGDVDRPAGYWKFKIKSDMPARTEGVVASSPAFTRDMSIPAPPTLMANDSANTLTVSHPLGLSEILISVDGAAFVSRSSAVMNVGNVYRPAGYYRYKVRAANGRSESEIANSPEFTLTPAAPTLVARDDYNTIAAYHSLQADIIVSINNGPYEAYTNKISVGNVDVPAGYYKFKVKAAAGRSESPVSSSPEFTSTTGSTVYLATPAKPTVVGNDSTNTLSASHELGESEIVVSENGGNFVSYTGTIDVGNVNRPAGYWKIKIRAATGRAESVEVSSPAFTYANIPAPPTINANDPGNTISATHALGASQILVSINDSDYMPYAGYLYVGNATRPAGYYKFKVKAAAGRQESPVAASPEFTFTPGAPTITAYDEYDAMKATHALGTSEIIMSVDSGVWEPYQGYINVGDVDRPAGYWRFRIKAAPGRSEGTIASSPVFTKKASATSAMRATKAPEAPTVEANDTTNILAASHEFGTSEIEVSENDGDYQSYAAIIVGDVDRPAGYWKFRVKAAGGRKESSAVLSPAFTKVHGPLGAPALTVFPNPVTGQQVNLKLQNFEAGKYTVTLFSSGGKAMLAQQLNYAGDNSVVTININQLLPQGIYILRVSNTKTSMTTQVIKQ